MRAHTILGNAVTDLGVQSNQNLLYIAKVFRENMYCNNCMSLQSRGFGEVFACLEMSFKYNRPNNTAFVFPICDLREACRKRDHQ